MQCRISSLPNIWNRTASIVKPEVASQTVFCPFGHAQRGEQHRVRAGGYVAEEREYQVGYVEVTAILVGLVHEVRD